MNGRATFAELYRAQGLCYIVGWAGAVPLVGPLLAGLAQIYLSVTLVSNVRAVHKLPLAHAVVVVALPGLLFMAVAIAMMLTLGAGIFLVFIGLSRP